MRSNSFWMAVALSAAAVQPALAVGQDRAGNAQSLDAVDLPTNSTLSGPGPITASPTRPAEVPGGKRMLPTRSTRLPARVLINGTAMSYGGAGANAIGNTGGLTTGPQGSAGAVAGGGGVHSGALVIAPGAVNGAMHSDESREHLTPQAAGVSGEPRQ